MPEAPIAHLDNGLAAWWQLASSPLPEQEELLTRFLCRGISALARPFIVSIEGLENVAPERDPFILVANHNQRLEAVLLPTLLIHQRRGKLLHFLADWPMCLVPLVGLLYRRSGAIVVGGKSAKPRWLNRFRSLYVEKRPAFERALERLRAGRSLGIFPEGTINRDPHHLLAGRDGAARLALTAQVPIVPVGIRFPLHASGPIRDGEKMAIEIGPALIPPSVSEVETTANFHCRIMSELARLSGKSFSEVSKRRKK